MYASHAPLLVLPFSVFVSLTVSVTIMPSYIKILRIMVAAVQKCIVTTTLSHSCAQLATTHSLGLACPVGIYNLCATTVFFFQSPFIFIEYTYSIHTCIMLASFPVHEEKCGLGRV